MSEYEKYQELQSKSQKLQEDYERQLEEMEASKEQALSELTEYFETKLQDKTGQLEQARECFIFLNVRSEFFFFQVCFRGTFRSSRQVLIKMVRFF